MNFVDNGTDDLICEYIEKSATLKGKDSIKNNPNLYFDLQSHRYKKRPTSEQEVGNPAEKKLAELLKEVGNERNLLGWAKKNGITFKQDKLFPKKTIENCKNAILEHFKGQVKETPKVAPTPAQKPKEKVTEPKKEDVKPSTHKKGSNIVKYTEKDFRDAKEGTIFTYIPKEQSATKGYVVYVKKGDSFKTVLIDGNGKVRRIGAAAVAGLTQNKGDYIKTPQIVRDRWYDIKKEIFGMAFRVNISFKDSDYLPQDKITPKKIHSDLYNATFTTTTIPETDMYCAGDIISLYSTETDSVFVYERQSDGVIGGWSCHSISKNGTIRKLSGIGFKTMKTRIRMINIGMSNWVAMHPNNNIVTNAIINEVHNSFVEGEPYVLGDNTPKHYDAFDSFIDGMYRKKGDVNASKIKTMLYNMPKGFSFTLTCSEGTIKFIKRSNYDWNRTIVNWKGSTKETILSTKVIPTNDVLHLFAGHESSVQHLSPINFSVTFTDKNNKEKTVNIYRKTEEESRLKEEESRLKEDERKRKEEEKKRKEEEKKRKEEEKRKAEEEEKRRKEEEPKYVLKDIVYRLQDIDGGTIGTIYENKDYISIDIRDFGRWEHDYDNFEDDYDYEDDDFEILSDKSAKQVDVVVKQIEKKYPKYKGKIKWSTSEKNYIEFFLYKDR